MPEFTFHFSTMGCPAALHLHAQTRNQAQRALDLAQAEATRLDRKYSHYRDDSLVATIAAIAGSDDALDVDEETASLLDFAAELHRQSDGLFDITAGALTRLWDLSSAKIPRADVIAKTLEHTGWSRVQWLRPRLRIPVGGMRLDLGGLVKEYAADRCAQVCRDAGIASGVVDLGGDLALIGPHPDGAPWLVGIKAPRSPESACARIALHAGSLATSGDYERAMIVDGRRYCHIIDPRSGYPVEGFASVSVVADRCLVAGAAATMAMLLGVERGKQWLDELGLPHLCIKPDGSRSGSIGISA